MMQQNTLPQFPQAAHQKLIQKVYAPVFFEKLANDWGIEASSPEEQGQLLELAGILRQTTEVETVKQATAGNSFLTEATESLKGVLNAHGYNHPTAIASVVKQAAAEMSADQEVQQATLEYGAWLAQMQQLAAAAAAAAS